MTQPEVEEIDRTFTYHQVTGDQAERYEALRAAGRTAAIAIVQCCPPSADRSAAIRKLREAIMTANASIALEPPEGKK